MASRADHQNSDYVADSESSNSWQPVSPPSPSDSWQTISPPPPTKMKSALKKSSKSRRATLRTPSEEGLYEGHFDLSRRPPTPYALSRHSTPDEDDRRTTKLHNDKRTQAVTAANTAANSAPSGVAPAVSQPGPNQIHAPGQPPFNTNQATSGVATSQPGQAPPVLFGNGITMDGYSNAMPNNYGLHFQPQVPDTSLGPMTHVYQPRFDNGCVGYPHPGIVVCHPSSFISIAQPTLFPALTAEFQPVRPITFAAQSVVVAPVPPAFIASAPVYTTLGYQGDDGVIAPRVLAVRRISPHLPSRFSDKKFCLQTR